METAVDLESVKGCSAAFMLAINDTMNVLTGKWKLHIMASLAFGKKRFKEMEREIPRITPRMLSKELRDLEMNGIVKRTVYNTIPVTVEYEFTQSGRDFKNVMDAMIEWGLKHRSMALGQ